MKKKLIAKHKFIINEILTFPDSILAKIASGVSSPVEANGVLPDSIM